MKVFTLTFVVLLLVAATSALAASKVKVKGDKRAGAKEIKIAAAREATKTDIARIGTDKKEKEIHKRGILHYGGSLAAAASLWPKTYASHYGYGVAAHPLSASASAAHLHSLPALKYHGHGFHYKALTTPPILPAAAVASLSSAWPPTYAGHAVDTAQPFIIRPGGAVVQSYSVTYPQRKPAIAVKPIHSFAAVAPVHHAVPAVQPVHSFQTVQAIQHVQPAPSVVPVQTLHQHLLPAVAPPPVQTVVQVQQYKPPFPYYDTQQFPSYFQTSFIPPAPAPAAIPALPQAPAVAFSPAPAVFPAIPTFPHHTPDFPNLPSIPVIPSQPSVPDVPAVPAVPSIPTIPSIPNFPQPQVPLNGFFPVNVQPPLNQKPPVFGSAHPQVPVAGFAPDFGSADAAPQIPGQSNGVPDLQLPLPQPEATQTPWKPVLYEPPTAEGPLGRPSHTLLPPYGSTPGEGYLPPAPGSQSDRSQQQEYTIDSSLFDNLSDADIQEIFSQASLAAHRDQHHHHTVHNYHTRY